MPKKASAKKTTLGADLIEGMKLILDHQRGKVELEQVWPKPIDVKAIRKRVKMSQAEFARTYGISKRALQEWEQRFAIVNYVCKGSNIFTEHYSAIQAEAPDPDDPTTQPNLPLIEALRQADKVLIAGEAGSHCVANTVRDLAAYLGDHLALSRMTLLTDAISPVPGFENYQEDFLRDLAPGLRSQGQQQAVLGKHVLAALPVRGPGLAQAQFL